MLLANVHLTIDLGASDTVLGTRSVCSCVGGAHLWCFNCFLFVGCRECLHCFMASQWESCARAVAVTSLVVGFGVCARARARVRA